MCTTNIHWDGILVHPDTDHERKVRNNNNDATMMALTINYF